jgi:autophagy-related protein 11
MFVGTNSASERKRRQVYRGEVHGQLPFDTKGMDQPVPTIDFSPSGSTDSVYSLERDDVEGYTLPYIRLT